MALEKATERIEIILPEHFPGKLNFSPGGSKSISNRALVISALSDHETTIHGLSDSEDTEIMQRLLDQREGIFDAGHAGTCFRFMTAYLALQPGTQVLTGSSRMQQRPVSPLVDALRKLGSQVKYLGKEGYPPIEISSIDTESYIPEVSIPGDVSSQFISALMMIGVKLPQGLEISILPPVLSRPYLDMTASIMQEFGAKVDIADSRIFIHPGRYAKRTFHVEADWSSASYPIGLMAIIRQGQLKVGGLKDKSLQGDSAILEIASHWGLNFEFDKEGLWVIAGKLTANPQMEWDFSSSPDLAPTVMAVNAALGIEAKYSGLKSLRIKESDRIRSMQRNLEQGGVGLVVKRAVNGNEEIAFQSGSFCFDNEFIIETFDDHRIAMACSLLAAKGKVTVMDPEVIIKSYPEYWQQLRENGFGISRQG